VGAAGTLVGGLDRPAVELSAAAGRGGAGTPVGAAGTLVGGLDLLLFFALIMFLFARSLCVSRLATRVSGRLSSFHLTLRKVGVKYECSVL
jgi:hypothetical protein